MTNAGEQDARAGRRRDGRGEGAEGRVPTAGATDRAPDVVRVLSAVLRARDAALGPAARGGGAGPAQPTEGPEAERRAAAVREGARAALGVAMARLLWGDPRGLREAREGAEPGRLAAAARAEAGRAGGIRAGEEAGGTTGAWASLGMRILGPVLEAAEAAGAAEPGDGERGTPGGRGSRGTEAGGVTPGVRDATGVAGERLLAARIAGMPAAVAEVVEALVRRALDEAAVRGAVGAAVGGHAGGRGRVTGAGAAIAAGVVAGGTGEAAAAVLARLGLSAGDAGVGATEARVGDAVRTGVAGGWGLVDQVLAEARAAGEAGRHWLGEGGARNENDARGRGKGAPLGVWLAEAELLVRDVRALAEGAARRGAGGAGGADGGEGKEGWKRTLAAIGRWGRERGVDEAWHRWATGARGETPEGGVEEPVGPEGVAAVRGRARYLAAVVARGMPVGLALADAEDNATLALPRWARRAMVGSAVVAARTYVGAEGDGAADQALHRLLCAEAAGVAQPDGAEAEAWARDALLDVLDAGAYEARGGRRGGGRAAEEGAVREDERGDHSAELERAVRQLHDRWLAARELAVVTAVRSLDPEGRWLRQMLRVPDALPHTRHALARAGQVAAILAAEDAEGGRLRERERETRTALGGRGWDRPRVGEDVLAWVDARDARDTRARVGRAGGTGEGSGRPAGVAARESVGGRGAAAEEPARRGDDGSTRTDGAGPEGAGDEIEAPPARVRVR